MAAFSDKPASAAPRSSAELIEGHHDGILREPRKSKIGDSELDNEMEKLLPTAPHHRLQMQRQQDYTKARSLKNAAYYMPAVSATFADKLATLKLPDQMDFTPDDLQFTNPNSELCF